MTCLSLETVVDAMLAAGCADAQIGATVRVLRETVSAENETVRGQQSQNPGQPSHPSVSRPAASAKAPAGDPKRLRAALNAAKTLSPAARRVGEVLCDLYRPGEGRSVVGTYRIVKQSGLSRATVFRALRALCAPGGPFLRLSYRGFGHCNAYPVNWAWADAVLTPSCVAAAREAARTSPVPPSDEVTPSQSQSQNETRIQKDIYPPQHKRSDSERGRARKRKHVLPGQRELLGPQLVAETPEDRLAAARMVARTSPEPSAPPVQVPSHLLRPHLGDLPGRKAAERLWKAYAAKLGEGRAWHLAKGLSGQAFAEGVAAERHRHGSGLEVFLDALMGDLPARRAAGTGPP